MTDENINRIRELEKRISEWDAEHQHGMQQQRSAIDDLSKTLSLSTRVALLGSIPSAGWIICWIAATRASEPIMAQIIFICMALAAFAVIVAGAARASGLAAHWWFRGSLIHERQATTVIALAAAIILFGWILVFLRWENQDLS